MRRKKLFIFLLFFAGICSVRSYGQQAIEDLVPRIEQLSESPPRRNSIETSVNLIRRQDDGSVLTTHKQFTINDFPNLVNDLIRVFNQEKERAQSVTESMKNGRIFRRYVFNNEGKTTICMLDGTENKMIFIYSQQPEESPSPMSQEERFFRGLPPE